MFLILLVIFVTLVFTYINGFHDTANSIATVVSTKVLTPRQAILLAAVTNLIGAFFGTAVATTIASGLVDAQIATMPVLCCAMLAAIAWNLLTWWSGLPSSSSHALIGGLCGAVFAASGNHWSSIIWSVPGEDYWWNGKGILWKVVVPMISSPLIGLVVGFIVMSVLYFLLRNWRPVSVNRVFGKLQLFSAGYMGFAHGTNDAQKTMGIIFLALVAGTGMGTFDSFNSHLNFLYAPDPIGSVAAANVELGLQAQAGRQLKDAADFFQMAAAAKDKRGEYFFAQALKNGAGVKTNEVKAAKLMAQLAADKFDESTAPVSEPICRKFKDLPSEPNAAVRWLKQKSDSGNADAMVALGVAYLRGTGVNEDESAACELFERASQRNHPAAFYDLGLMYHDGLGVPKDEAMAGEMFRKCIKAASIPTWIKILCALTMCAGTAAGGWRIIRTLGHKMVKIHPVQGFAAEATGASVLFTAAHFGMPVSTTHAITASIMGVGCAKGFNALKWNVVERILWAWVLTLPASAAVAYALVNIARSFGWL
jgi:phosphate/sulfate permease